MRSLHLFLNVFLLLILAYGGGQAQEALVPAGGIASGSGGSVSYSAGQVAYTLYTNVKNI